MGNSEPHMFIEELIPTVDQEEGICYTHPENIPGNEIHILEYKLLSTMFIVQTSCFVATTHEYT